ncbi:LysR family transcriptional regulator [Glacieibacterium megasporae]|uniref:LysR family transcriptional regulator n=1 Tax=Glacieibacterium megasporae TaxID=2835787 RepID=UPI001C1E2FA8|nr:LysR family transcriptional regulator [Polymorphobacter megasporae]UAJ10862.1 LysR family transcriptional regulator [Polymorphobacter megasporae]
MEPDRLNLRHLDVFAAIVRLGSVSAAAAAANLTQPAVTQGLARLEHQLVVALFDRHPGGMTATAAARGFAPRVEAALVHVASRRVTMAQLTAFVAVARGGSYVSASAATGLAQPSLHRAVRDLSLELGRPLVERRGRGLVLTAAGLRTARGFRLALGELAAGLAELKGLQGLASGRIAIGAMPLARARVLPAIVAEYHRAFPHVEIVIAEGSHAELIEPLRDGELDLLIGALRDPVPGPDVVQTPLFDDHPVIIGRAGHPLAHAPHTTAQLANFEWIVSARGTPLRTMWEAMFIRAGIAVPRVPVECGSVILIRGLLLDSDCLTMLSPDQVAVELAAGLLATIGGEPAGTVRTIGLTARTGWIPTPDQRAFIDQAIATAGQTS